MAGRNRIVAVGDLNGAHDVLRDILRGTRLVDKRGDWCGGNAQLVQMGDLFNRGGGARDALLWLLSLKRQAARAGGRVTVLLGNHEVMTALGHEAYCTVEEYLSFATERQRDAWRRRVQRQMKTLFQPEGRRGPILPLEPRLEAWKISRVPGRTAMRKELGPTGRLGKALRALPVAYVHADLLFCHSTIRPEWAELGVRGLNRRAKRDWSQAPAFWGRLSRDSLFRSPSSPLWDRSLATGGREASAVLRASLKQLGVSKMIVGHTQAKILNGGHTGRVHLRFGGRLVLVDVSLQSGRNTPRAALVVQGRRGWEWTPAGRRLLWDG